MKTRKDSLMRFTCMLSNKCLYKMYFDKGKIQKWKIHRQKDHCKIIYSWNRHPYKLLHTTCNYVCMHIRAAMNTTFGMQIYEYLNNKSIPNYLLMLKHTKPCYSLLQIATFSLSTHMNYCLDFVLQAYTL